MRVEKKNQYTAIEDRGLGKKCTHEPLSQVAGTDTDAGGGGVGVASLVTFFCYFLP